MMAIFDKLTANVLSNRKKVCKIFSHIKVNGAQREVSAVDPGNADQFIKCDINDTIIHCLKVEVVYIMQFQASVQLMLAGIEVEDGITDKICFGIIGILFKSKARLAAITG
jgi:hypothetical protein